MVTSTEDLGGDAVAVSWGYVCSKVALNIAGAAGSAPEVSSASALVDFVAWERGDGQLAKSRDEDGGGGPAHCDQRRQYELRMRPLSSIFEPPAFAKGTF